MNTLIVYMVKTAVYLTGFFLIYRIFLSKDTMYVRNRFFILLSALTAFVLPLVTFETKNQISIPLFGRIFSEILVSGNSDSTSHLRAGYPYIDGLKWIYIIYLTGLVLFSLKLVFDIFELFRLIISREDRNDHIIIFHNFNTSGFSAFGFIFINKRLSPDEAAEIIRHEQKHLDQVHSLDIILMEIIRVVQWFNPVIHMYCRSLRAVHEFQADSECLKTGISVSSYQGLLLNQIFRSKAFTITNSFSNPTLIKKRMIMMTKKSSRSLANLKLLMVLPVIAAVLFIISSCNQSNKSAENSTEIAPPPPPPPPPPPAGDISSDTPLESADEMPVFKGGDAALLDFIVKNTKYPEGAKTKGTQGKVIVRFAVEADGSVDKVSILKSVDPELDQEAFRVVSSLPDFEKPGKKDARNVAVWYMVPINFALN